MSNLAAMLRPARKPEIDTMADPCGPVHDPVDLVDDEVPPHTFHTRPAVYLQYCR